MAVHLDVIDAEFQLRGQACNHAEATAPLAIQRSSGCRLRREMLEDALGAAEIAWDEGTVVIATMVPPDAPVCLAQERPDIGANGTNRARSRHITQGHA